jgi:hypothetical protein
VNITGIEFIFDDGRPSAMLGYATPGAQQMTRKKYASKQRRGPFDAYTEWSYPGVRVTMDVVGIRGIVYLKAANGIHGVAIYHGEEEFDEIDDTLNVGIQAHYGGKQEPVAYSVSLDKVKKVIAVVDVSLCLFPSPSCPT